MKKTSYILLVSALFLLAACSKENDCFNMDAEKDNSSPSSAGIEIVNDKANDNKSAASLAPDGTSDLDGIRDGDSNDDDDDLEDKRKKSKG